MFINPWDKKSEKYLFLLAKDQRLFVDDIRFTRDIGNKYPGYKKFMGIARNGDESIVALRPGVRLAPMPTRRKFHKFQFYRIF